jgi:hypothetical protein
MPTSFVPVVAAATKDVTVVDCRGHWRGDDPQGQAQSMARSPNQSPLVSGTGDTTEGLHDTWDWCGKVEPLLWVRWTVTG